jgi:hypothetical protein
MHMVNVRRLREVEGEDSTLRGSYLSEYWFSSPAQVREIVDDLRGFFKHRRSYRMLGHPAPARDAAACPGQHAKQEATTYGMFTTKKFTNDT